MFYIYPLFGGSKVSIQLASSARSAGMLRYMDTSVAGISVPDGLIERFPHPDKGSSDEEKKKAKAEAEETGKRIAVEIIEKVREIEGVQGVHIQAIGWEKAIPEVAKAAGLLPRP